MLNNSTFSSKLLNWFDLHGRKNLPWQQNPTPYHVWVSEIMLQQTQVATVIPYYQHFTEQFQDIKQLAAAPVDGVLAMWTGLGYYARARNLHKTAQIVSNDYNGIMPADLDKLIALPGIGRSTAGAIMTLAYHQRFPILDGNVKRVLTRYFAIEGWPGKKQVENQLWQYAEDLLPSTRFANYVQAQMDLGATLCTRSNPNCNLCPLTDDCKAFNNQTQSLYPNSKPKQQTPTRYTHWLIAINEKNEVLLEQRPQTGVWGGLWTFPAHDTDDLQSLQQQYDTLRLSVLSQQSQPQFKHVFSHFKLMITPVIVHCQQQTSQVSENNHQRWYKIDQALSLGLPAPVKTVLENLL